MVGFLLFQIVKHRKLGNSVVVYWLYGVIEFRINDPDKTKKDTSDEMSKKISPGGDSILNYGANEETLTLDLFLGKGILLAKLAHRNL